jgi:hypothetical protein
MDFQRFLGTSPSHDFFAPVFYAMVKVKVDCKLIALRRVFHEHSICS